MKQKKITACQLIACVLLATGSAPAGAQPLADRSASFELRAQLFTASYRWSNDLYEFGQWDRYPAHLAERSLYFSPGLGLRVFSSLQHGLLVDGEYRFDTNFDGFFDEEEYRIRFGVAHVGYAYRHVIHPRRSPHRRAWALTPHVSAAAGVARKLDYLSHEFIPEKSPVVGVRVGVDLDFHIQRFFMGWSLRYEYLRHTKGELRYSHFLSWNAIPFIRIGVNLGGRVQRQTAPLDER